MLKKSLDQLKLLIVVGVLVLVAQKIGFTILDKEFSVVEAIPGIILIVLICMLSLIIKGLLPNLKFPAFAWATMIALVLSMPFMPTAKLFLEYTNKINFLSTTTPILAFAGISVGNKVKELKSMSWKIVLISLVVFTSTFFGSAIISQIVLKIQGII
ncbi:hypothetical protein SH2C18_03370 [Clostridium sediminicola]|uniref:hypothetical protein n=1 Tax=Clostridium sediminicola TaxID=3114879 RepID=UPI0031F2057C